MHRNTCYCGSSTPLRRAKNAAWWFAACRSHIAPALVSFLVFAPQVGVGGLERFATLLRADATPAPRDSIRVTYLGVNGYQLEANGRALLIDPYFTRASFSTIALGQPLRSDPARVDAGLKHVRPAVDAILVTHAHFDHLLDAPSIMKKTGARLITGPTGVALARASGAPRDRCKAVQPGSTHSIGPWKIRVLPAAHDRLFGRVPYSGAVRASTEPRKARDWVVGEPLAFLVEANGRRVYIESGGLPEPQPQIGAGRVDLAILSAALRDSRRRFPAVVQRLSPRFVLPSHQDNFFRPFDRGFSFAMLSDFGSVRRMHAGQKRPGELILLDYFKPWTIP